ncbi:hypothetical protein IAT40_005839 [Kwoniella sp. CBS 6097]
MPSWTKGNTAGQATASRSNLGSLEGLSNNTNPKWWRDPGLIRLNLIILGLTFCSVTNGYDSALINNLQALDSWKAILNHPNASMLGLISAVQTAGSAIGSPFVPKVMDGYGRRWTIFAGGAITLIGGILQTFAYSVGQYIAGRIVVGIGQMFCIVAGQTLITEIAHPRLRFYIIGYFQVIYYIGSIVASWLCYGIRISYPNTDWQWRGPTLLIAIWGLLLVGLFFVVPESPRFLLAKGRDDEAKSILLKYHANDAAEDELVSGEITEIKEAFAFENAHTTKTWKQCFSTPGDRWRMLISVGLSVCSMWTGQQIVSYYNTQILAQAGIKGTLPVLGINGGLAFFSFFCAIGGATISGRIGRRPLFLASFIGQLLTLAIVTALSARYAATKYAPYGYASIAFIWLNSGFWNIAMNPLVYSYQTEIHSYSTRAKGLSLFLLAFEIQAIVNRYVNPIGLANLGWKYYLVFMSFYSFELAFFYFVVPETKGRSLEEISEIFDGPQVQNTALKNLESVLDEDDLKKHVVEVENHEGVPNVSAVART